ncbi:MAG: UrcA family protein [Parvularcula sp.]|jgi:UrcA family protein|nr:UrcA family protein [Parvularcula sp.]
MNKNKIFSAFAAAGILFGTATATPGQDLDSFAIDVSLTDIDTRADLRRFEKRLSNEAFDYCRDAAPWATRVQLEDCQVMVIEAVQEQLSEQARVAGMNVAWSQ